MQVAATPYRFLILFWDYCDLLMPQEDQMQKVGQFSPVNVNLTASSPI